MVAIPVHYETDDAGFAQLSQYVLAEMRRLNVPGVAIGLHHKGREHMAGFGVTNVENPLPVTADTLFQIGSTTKTVTGTIVMQLVEKNLIDLDEPLKTYLPELRLADKTAEGSVTMRHLLTHMGGWAGDFFRETGSGDDALTRYVAEMASLEQLTPVGTVWAYNNAGFGLAARVIEVVTGQTYERAAQDYLLGPLGMDNSYFDLADVISRSFVVGHRMVPDRGVVVERPWALSRASNAIGGLCSSARDQLRYARFHLGDGTTATGQRILSADSMAIMQSVQYPANFGMLMGLSWRIKEYGATRAVMHGGATNGQMSAFLMIPSEDFAITVLTNADQGGILHDNVVGRALEQYLGLKEPDKTYLDLSVEQLGEYLGSYDAQMAALDLYFEKGQLMVSMTPKGGFPDISSPAPTAPAPSRLAFFGPDRVIALDEPLINTKAEFLRDKNGQIEWLRTSRLHRRRD